jgi:signal transduction histidine kinase
MQQPWSLRGRLIRLFAAGGFAAWLFGGAVVLLIVGYQDKDSGDMAIQNSAAIILRLALEEYGETGTLDALKGDAPLQFSGRMIQILDANGRLLLRTDDAPTTPMATPQPGFRNIKLAGGNWRVGIFRDADSGLQIEIADSESRIEKQVIQLGIALLMPIVIGLPILMIGAWFFAARALRPLRRAALNLGERKSSDLSLIGAGELPQEAMPLVESFNHLLMQLAESWEDERRFAASVAHELRTPLAGIRLNLQRLQQHSDEPAMRARLDVLVGAVDRAARVIEQLLVLARLERDVHRELSHEPIDLRRIIDETLSEFASRAGERGLRFEVDAEAAPVRVPAQAFYLVLRNFVENAVRHSPREGCIQIGAGRSETDWWLQVDDAGPGLLPAPLTQAPGSQDEKPLITENLQIGLSLVRKISELFDGQVTSGRSALLGGASFRFSAPLLSDLGKVISQSATNISQ